MSGFLAIARHDTKGKLGMKLFVMLNEVKHPQQLVMLNEVKHP
jgi:hypothetical protein